MKMNRLTLFVITVVTVFSLIGCAGKGGKKDADSGVEYYRSVLFSETPFDVEIGTTVLQQMMQGALTVINLHTTATEGLSQLNFREMIPF